MYITSDKISTNLAQLTGSNCNNTMKGQSYVSARSVQLNDMVNKLLQNDNRSRHACRKHHATLKQLVTHWLRSIFAKLKKSQLKKEPKCLVT